MLNNVLALQHLFGFQYFSNFTISLFRPSLAACTCTRVHLAPKKRRNLQRLQKHILIEASFAPLR